MNIAKELMNTIEPDLIILIGVIYFIGEYLRNSQMKNEHIPLLLTMISIFMCALKMMVLIEITSYKSILDLLFASITQGVVVVGMAVYFNQLVKQHDKLNR